MSFVEKTELVEVNHLIPTEELQVKWRWSVLLNEQVISAQDRYRVYNPSQRADFEAEVVGAEKYVHLIEWSAAEATVI